MPRTITEDQLMQKARELGTVAAANRWMQENGYTLAPNPIPPAQDGELPPAQSQQSPAQGGALSAAGGLDEDDEESMTTLAALGDGSLDFNKLSDPRVFQQMYQSQLAAARQQEQSAKEMFEQAKRKLTERYAGPGQAEQLFALSRALLAPRSMPGFQGFLQNTMGTLADMETAKRQADMEREERLAALQAQYQQGAASRASDQRRSTLDLLKTYASVNKPRDMGVWSEQLGRFVPKDRPTVIAVGATKEGLRTEKLSDGTIRVYDASGRASLYDAGGNLIQGGAQ